MKRLKTGFEHRHQILYLNQNYGIQQEFLLSDADVQQKELFVSKFVALQRKDGSFRSVCTWTQTVECLLPKSDYVGFAIVNRERTKADYLGEVRWDEAVKILGNQMLEENGMYPPCFRNCWISKFRAIEKAWDSKK